MTDDLELPLGKRTRLYRFFEILPGALSYSMIIALFVFSLISPTLGAIYLLIIITITLVKAVGVAVRTVQGYREIQQAMKVDWRQRYIDLETPHEKFEALRGSSSRAFNFDEHIENLRMMSVAPNDFPDPKKVYHAVIMVAYNEGMETLVPTVEAVRDTTFDNERIIFVLGYEERGGKEIEENAKKLKEMFKGVFYDFIIVKHPDGLPQEIKGKGPNLTYAGQHLAEYVAKKKIPMERVIVTSLDADNRMSKGYLDYVAYEFVVNPDRKRMAFQPVSLFMNNIWDASAPMRVIAVSNSFFNVINVKRPHLLRNFASHSQPLDALYEMDFWSKRTIVEDGHQYWRSLFHFRGKYEVLSIKVPIYQDAVLEESFWKTVKAQFVQLRRWDYGASDVAYVGVRMADKKRRKMPLWLLFPKFMRLLDGHVTLAAMSPIVAFGGWIPRLLNFQSRELLTYNLPVTVSWIQLFASIGLMVTVLVSLRMLPPRPKKYNRVKSVGMVLQWVLSPVVAIVYQSAAAFYAQTRLLTANYMEKFDVTKKIVKK
ncbi:glycosyltransferase family 2 protein [Candidatus Saccharibacteria bacterium]|nr:glycosyltransferase family 2 protein [Candidatus Saccharibacteria bacterium]